MIQVYYFLFFIVTLISQSECGCRFLQQDIVFGFDESSSVDDTQFNRMLDFAINLTSINLTVSKSETRVGAVAFGDQERVLFGLKTHINHRAVQNALQNVLYQGTNLTGSNGSRALQFIKSTFLTSAHGDRKLIQNYVILFTSSSDEKTVQAAKELRSDNMTRIIAIATGNANMTQLIEISGKSSDVIYVSSFDDVDYALCKRVRSIMPYCFYYCSESYFSYSNPAALATQQDNDIDKLYLLSDNVFTFTCCGVISVWEFYPVGSGTLDFMVWRPNGTGFELVGVNTVVVKVNEVKTTLKYSVPSYERIAITAGDIIGWRSHGINILPYTDCYQHDDVACPKSTFSLDWAGQLTEGMRITIYNMDEVNDRAYAIKAITTNNTALVFSQDVFVYTIPDHLKTGDYVTPLELSGIDYRETPSYNIIHSMAEEYFRIDFIQRKIFVSHDLDRKQHHYQFVLSVSDSCRNNASATFTIKTVNWPPIVSNLPRTVYISESIRGGRIIYNLTIQSSGDDPICCSIYDTSPLTTNFQLIQNGTDVSVVTSPWATFNYDKINSFLIYVCCEDVTASAKALLKVNIRNETPKRAYRHPVWLYVAVVSSAIPISIMMTLSYAVIISAMFQVEESSPQKVVFYIKRYRRVTHAYYSPAPSHFSYESEDRLYNISIGKQWQGGISAKVNRNCEDEIETQSSSTASNITWSDCHSLIG